MAKELESSKNHRVLVGTMMEQSSYSGPLPKPSIYTRYCLPWCRNLSRRARSRYACMCNHCHNCSIGFYFLFEENPEKRQLKITLIPCFS